MDKRLDASIKVLTNRSADIVERENEAMGLTEGLSRRLLPQQFIPNVREALEQVTTDPEDHARVQHEAAHALVFIWLDEGRFPREIYDKLTPAAREVVREVVLKERPNWLSAESD